MDTDPDALPSLAFVKIHWLAHKMSQQVSPELSVEYSTKALQIMDEYQAIHPAYPQFHEVLRGHDPDLAARYGEDWSTEIRQKEVQEYLNEEPNRASTDKNTQFDDTLAVFQKSFIQGNFHVLSYHINKLSLSVSFSNHCDDHSSLINNRHFEFLFYRMLTVLFSQLWFPQPKSEEQPQSSSDTVTWVTLEKKCDNYYAKCCSLLDSVHEKSPESVSSFNTEINYYHLAKWLSAFAKFKENRLEAYVQDFHKLQDQLHLLDILDYRTEALLYYAIACIATRPFKELNLKGNDQLLDEFTSESAIESEVYSILVHLSAADFPAAKKLLVSPILQKLDGYISYGLPTKTAGTFWDYLTNVIDSKVFLLIMSITKSIPRDKALDKIGYADADASVRKAVSTKLTLLIAVLGLGQMGIYYDQGSDAFYNIPTGDEAKELELQRQIDDADHLIRAEAAANQIRTMMIAKYF